MIILASASPRRKELLSLICDNFKIIPAGIDESLDGNVNLYDIPEYLAIQKAAAVHKNHPDFLSGWLFSSKLSGGAI